MIRSLISRLYWRHRLTDEQVMTIAAELKEEIKTSSYGTLRWDGIVPCGLTLEEIVRFIEKRVLREKA